MNLRKRIGLAVGSVLVTGALLTGAAVASDKEVSAPAIKAEMLDKAVQEGKLTQGEADTLKQLGELRRSYMERYKADAKALVEQAVKDGKVTREQADRLMEHKGRHMHGKHHGMKGKPLTEDQLKSKLDAAVKEGKLTQEKADAILKKFQEHRAKQ